MELMKSLLQKLGGMQDKPLDVVYASIPALPRPASFPSLLLSP